MAKMILSAVIAIHGLIHLVGFAKAFRLAEIEQLTQPISKPSGLFWLASAVLFVLAAIAIPLKKDWWWMVATAAVLISQVLIIVSWRDAKLGTIANAIILVAVVTGFGAWSFNRMVAEERRSILRSRPFRSAIIDGAMVIDLPSVVQKWIRRSNIIGKETHAVAHRDQVRPCVPPFSRQHSKSARMIL